MKLFNRTLRNTISWTAGTVVLCLLLAAPVLGDSAILYKSYVVRYDRGWDILCDPYIVQKGDWVYKIFRKKGEISSNDFQEFLEIFKRLNPQIHDINRIRPNQNILIPIKKIEPNAFANQSKGLVTIPFVTISKTTELLQAYAKAYRVQKGDFISRLISERFGKYGSKSYREGMEIFKTINPNMKNMDLIYVGQKIMLPDPGVQNEPWYQSLFDTFGKIKNELGTTPPENDRIAVAVTDKVVQAPTDSLSQAAAILDAKLLKKGVYFFPQAGKNDYQLDLARFPVFEMKDGTRIIIKDNQESNTPDLGILRSFWKNVRVVEVEQKTSVPDLLESVMADKPKNFAGNTLSFKDRGLEITVTAKWIQTLAPESKTPPRYTCITVIENDSQKTSDAIKRFLDQHGIQVREIVKDTKEPPSTREAHDPSTGAAPFRLSDVTTIAPTDQKTFIFDLLDALGYTYYKNIRISFPYAGVQIHAFSTLVATGKGNDFLVDFGELYGDAVQEIKKTGINAIQLKTGESRDQMIEKLLGAIGTPFVPNPSFLAAKRSDAFNTELKISGFLIDRTGTDDILISGAPLHNRVLQFLNETGVKVILTGLLDA